jgi:hypothetical protein
MSELITSILKNIGCSYCQEYQFEESYNKNNFKGWKLYLKEYDMYSAMILYNEKLEKDISHYFKKGENIFLLNDKEEIVLKLEYLSDNESEKTEILNINKNAILVPTEEYQEFYENIEAMEKSFDVINFSFYTGADVCCKPP